MKFSKFTILFAATFCIFCARNVNGIVKGKYFDRFFLIIFENTDYEAAIQDPYLKHLTSLPNSTLLSNFFAVAHPSEPNYIAQIYGSTAGILDDVDYNIAGNNLVDLENGGISWKVYLENFPENCYKDTLGLENRTYLLCTKA